MKYSGELVLEVTRQCNMKCSHCLRGESQRLHLQRQVLEAVLDQVEYVQSITFTGGEPTLVPERIEWFVKGVRQRDVRVGGFYVATNGKAVPLRFVQALIDLYDWCEEPDQCYVVKSHTQFHDTAPISPLLNALRFFNPEERGRLDLSHILNEGRAKETQTGNPDKVNTPDKWMVRLGDPGELTVLEGSVYITVRGDVVPGCDFSYKRQQRLKVGNILQKPLAAIVSDSIHKVMEED